MEKRGSKITLKIGGVLYQGLTSKDVDFSTETEDATNQDSGGFKKHNAGDKAWTVNFEGMYDPSHTYGLAELLNAWKTGDDVTVLIEGDTAGDLTIAGNATITNAKATFGHGSTATGSGTLTGNGEVTFGTVAA